MRPSILVLGQPSHTRQLTAAFASTELLAHGLTPGQALRSAGSMLGADLVVLSDPPGRHATLEAEAYAAGVGVLHVWWDAMQAEVGPFTSQGLGPCPTCLAGSAPQAAPGCAAPLGTWACALATLECAALFLAGQTELLGASWRWRLDQPGLSLALWPGREACPTSGCVQP